MKNSGQCPKCGSHDIIRVLTRHDRLGLGVNIMVKIWPTVAVPITRYLCSTCGYLEEWVDSPENIAKVRDQYRGEKQKKNESR